jgi:hypothetical protein
MMTDNIVIVNKTWCLQFHKVLKLGKWEALDGLETWTVLYVMSAVRNKIITPSYRNQCH